MIMLELITLHDAWNVTCSEVNCIFYGLRRMIFKLLEYCKIAADYKNVVVVHQFTWAILEPSMCGISLLWVR